RVTPAVGPAFTQDTTPVPVGAGSNTFQQLSFTGGQADLADFTVRLGALPPGLAVGYPGDASVSRPTAGGSLLGRSTDTVAVRFDVTRPAPGSYRGPLVMRETGA